METADQKQTYLALPPSDGTPPQVLSSFTLNAGYHKKIEQAGEAYEELKFAIHYRKKGKKNPRRKLTMEE